MSHEIHTDFQGWAEGLAVELSDRRWLRLNIDEDIAVAVLLLPDDDRQDPSQVRVTARGKLQVSADEYKALENHAVRVDLTSQAEWTDEQWEQFVSPPVAVRQILLPELDRLEKATAGVVRTLRWRFYQPGPPVTAESLTFSLDGETWTRPWLRLSKLSRASDVSEIAEATTKDMTQLIDEGRAPPLAWDLYYDALRLRTASPRAAFVLAFTAAEVGVKEFGGRSSESERWLLESLQAPPLATMLMGYIPRLVDVRVKSTDKKDLAVPRWIVKVIDGAASKRNKIVHSPLGFDPKYDPSSEDLGSLMRAVADLLHLLDWFDGCDWAFSFLTEETRDSYCAGAIPEHPPSALKALPGS